MTIWELRRKTGLSQRQFAEQYHLNLRTLQNWEQGRPVPDSVLYMLNTLIDGETPLRKDVENAEKK